MGGWAGCAPIHPQEAAGQAGGVVRRVGAQRIDSCDHRPGIFLATRVGKGRSDCLLRLERGVSSAHRNSCTRQILEQERSANRMILQWWKYHTKLGDVNGTRIWVLSHQHLVPQSLGEAHETQSQVSRVLALESATCTILETSFSFRILSF